MKTLIKLGGILLLTLTALTACSDPAADLKKLQNWDKENVATQQQIQNELQQSLATLKDPKDLQPILDNYKTKVQDLVKSLDQVEIKSNEIKPLKEKSKQVFLAATEVTVDSLNTLIVSRSEESVQALKEKTQALEKSVGELSKLQSDLEQKYGEKTDAAKPAAPAQAPQADAAPAQTNPAEAEAPQAEQAPAPAVDAK
ncbi:hypothetical protein EDC45_0103 [Mesocricetibacter intestinalis]|uniref:Lipoprotein HlpB n=1 Tax=Mesocricetibacter intestinalis TaxID=1521930 RepID=A0A4R6VEP7_9PAST|nr:hypothetical protein [Mesocricetibacter intestinalis]TDQ59455.1 hypothetical protein EDC45_0103 [Mesocricetibacter intestinalis]